MADINALVVFYTQYGAAEQLALAAGVGALQGRANIRLRRLEDPGDDAACASDEARRAERARLLRDYVLPRPADPAWADVIVFATSAGGSGQIEAYVQSLAGIGSMAGKLAAVLGADSRGSLLAPIHAAAAAAGFVIVPHAATPGGGAAAATTYGRRVVEMARKLKAPV